MNGPRMQSDQRGQSKPLAFKGPIFFFEVECNMGYRRRPREPGLKPTNQVAQNPRTSYRESEVRLYDTGWGAAKPVLENMMVGHNS